MTRFLIDKVNNFGEGKLKSVTLGGKEILIINKGGRYFAINNICSHAGSRLHTGILQDDQVICPWHGATWNIETGELLWFSQKLKSQESYEVMVENDNIFVEF